MDTKDLIIIILSCALVVSITLLIVLWTIKFTKKDKVFILNIKNNKYRIDILTKYINTISNALDAPVIPIFDNDTKLQGCTKEYVLKLFDLYKEDDDLK